MPPVDLMPRERASSALSVGICLVFRQEGEAGRYRSQKQLTGRKNRTKPRTNSNKKEVCVQYNRATGTQMLHGPVAL